MSRDFLESETVECSTCGGGGERVVLRRERDGREEVVRGVEALKKLRSGGWTHEGVRECPRCNGFGRRNAAEEE